MQYTNSISFEIIPPKTSDKLLALEKNISQFLEKGFKYFSIVTQIPTATMNFVEQLKNKFPELILTPHLALINNSPFLIEQALTLYQKLHIEKILVVRGDLRYTKKLENFTANADQDVMALIQRVVDAGFQCFATCYPDGHPFSKTQEENILNAKKKASLGCRGLVSQCIYNIKAFQHFHAHLKNSGCDIPIIPSILPLLNNIKLQDFAARNRLALPTQLQAATKEEKSRFYADLIQKLLKVNQKTIPRLSYSTLNDFTEINKILCTSKCGF